MTKAFKMANMSMDTNYWSCSVARKNIKEKYLIQRDHIESFTLNLSWNDEMKEGELMKNVERILGLI